MIGQTTSERELADVLLLTELEWVVIREAVKDYEAGSDQMQRVVTNLHHKLRLLNDRQVVRIVRDRNE